MAVLSVIFYHVGLWPFSGGFVGVDVFFVISGYLITGKLVREMRSDRFSFVGFCQGRGRRLLPALLVTIALSFVAGAFFFSPIDFQRQSASTIAAIFGVSNVGFWLEADYFDAAAILKPLLHTWSLAVEMQFYLIWPFVIMLIAKRALATGLIALTIAGFVAAVAAMQVDQTAAFFLTPFRVWEFSIGGLVYAIEQRAPRNRLVADTSYVAGALAVLVPIVTYSDVTPFPGYSALAPVVGTAAMILFGQSSRLARLATIRPAVFLGEISYSAYLVHWPLIVFVQHILVRELAWGDKAILIVATIALAVALYYLVEAPFRKPVSLGYARPVMVYLCVMAGVAVPAASSVAGDGWAWRMAEEIQAINQIDNKEMRSYLWRQFPRYSETEFTSDRPNLIIVGDSQAADLLNMLRETGYADRANVKTFRTDVRCGTVYIPNENTTYWTKENGRTVKEPKFIEICKDYFDRFFKSTVLAKADVILIANLWAEYSIPYLADTVRYLQSRTHAQIFVLGRKDLARSSVELVNTFGRLTGIETWAATQKDPAVLAINAQIKDAVGDHFLDMMSIVCSPNGPCTVLASDTEPVFMDKAHVTPSGAALLGRRLLDAGVLPKTS